MLFFYFIYRQVFKHNYAKDAHRYTHTRTRTLFTLMGVKDNDILAQVCFRSLFFLLSLSPLILEKFQNKNME